MTLAMIIASGEAMLHGFGVMLLFIGLIGFGLFMQGVENKKVRVIGTMILVSGIVLALAMTVYYLSHPDHRPF